jgi:hypothetical protein
MLPIVLIEADPQGSRQTQSMPAKSQRNKVKESIALKDADMSAKGEILA